MAADRARAAGHRRHLGAADGLVSNPGTMNAIINFAKRPAARAPDPEVAQGRQPARPTPTRRPAGASRGKPGKCWERSEQTEFVPNILKGGEDSIGVNEAIQRVYFNIGSCAEQCWINHIPDLRAVDPHPAQLRPDAVRHRPVPARLRELPGDRGPAERRQGVLPAARGRPICGARAAMPIRATSRSRSTRSSATARSQQGRDVFARTCARCHSSQKRPVRERRLPRRRSERSHAAARLAGQRRAGVREPRSAPTRRARCTPITCEAGSGSSTPRSTSMSGRPIPNRREVMKGGGRGYYRNISLLSAWAHAPFLHNNAIGPEICGKPSDASVDFYSSPYVDADDKPLPEPAGLLALRSERRRPLQAVQGVDGDAAQSRAADPEAVHARPGRQSSTWRPR